MEIFEGLAAVGDFEDGDPAHRQNYGEVLVVPLDRGVPVFGDHGDQGAGRDIVRVQFARPDGVEMEKEVLRGEIILVLNAFVFPQK